MSHAAGAVHIDEPDFKEGDMTQIAAAIGRIHLIMIPSTDPDRTIAFYEALGFTTRADFPFGDGARWVELFPPDGTAGLALAPGEPEATGIDTGLILTTDDIDALHAELRDRGVEVDAHIARPGGDVTIGSAPPTSPAGTRRCSACATRTATR